MILILFGFFVLISLVMITIGLARPSESAQALVGFFFMFVLSGIMLSGDLAYPIGKNTTISYSYSLDINSSVQINNTVSLERDEYNQFNDTTSHIIGYYLAIASAVGFIGTMFSIRKSNLKSKDEEEND